MPHLKSYLEFRSCVTDLITAPAVREMNEYIQHSDITTLEHCIFVAYTSFLVCRFFGFDCYSASRGGLLHDLFLYDWHVEHTPNGLHGFTHPATALNNANRYFVLNDMEQDIIKKHMWPLTLRPPKYKESLVVCGVDKFCALAEISGLYKRSKAYMVITSEIANDLQYQISI